MKHILKEKTKGRSYLIFGLVILLLAGIFVVRFYRLSEVGLRDDDTLNYARVAYQWFFRGDFMNPYAKPAYHALSCLAIGIWGFYDFTLLYLCNLLDIFSIILIILIARQIGIRWAICIGTGLLYAFLPLILLELMRALPHLPSSTFFLLAFYLFLCSLHARRYFRIFLFFCGLATTFAVDIHPTLLSGAAFFFFVLAVRVLPRFNPSQDRWKGLKDLLVFLLGCAIVYLTFILLVSGQGADFGEKITGAATKLLEYRDKQGQGHRGSLISKYLYAFQIVPEMFSKPVTAFFILTGLSGLFLFVRQWKPFSKQKIKQEWSRVYSNPTTFDLSLIWGVIVFLFVTFIIAINGIQARFLLPLVPLTVLGFAGLIESFSMRYPRARIVEMFVVFAVTATAFNIGANSEWVKKPMSLSRQIAEVLYEKVDANNRVLMTPSHLGQSYSEVIYLDGDFVYRLLRPWKPEFRKLQEFGIRYIVVVKPKSGYCKIKDPDHLKLEYFQIASGIKELGGRKLFESDDVVIFEIPHVSNPRSRIVPPTNYPFYWVTHLYEPVQMKK